MKRILGWILILVCTAWSAFVVSGCKNQENGYTRYEITAEYIPENRTLTGTTKVTFENGTDNEISVLKFQLYPNAYRQDALYSPISTAYKASAYYAGESYGEMVISSVHGSKNWEVLGEDENILYAYLERSLFPGDKVVLDIGFMTKLAQVNHRTGVTEHTVNLGNFFPILCGIKDGGFMETVYYSDGDPFYSDCAEYKVTLTAPKEYVVATTGEIVQERSLESKKVHTMYAMNVRDFALVLSENFRVTTTKHGDTTLAYYYYDDETPTKTLDLIRESFTFYEKTFGKYPYGNYAVAQTGFCYGGMEYPCLAFISDGLDEGGKARVVAHETAHQWWYGVVGSDQIENAWQDEGLAEYSTIMFFEEYEKYGFTRENLVKEAVAEYRSFYDVYGSVLGRADTRMTRNLKDFLSDYEYKCISYDKAVIMWDTMRKSVGEQKMVSALRKYYSRCQFKNATAGDLIGSFEKTGLDVGGFFDSFLSGKAIL
ncbi:MAG: M1 family metallopeptidase [Clostridiales bacterium]|nr:M1 family metallopeptidase [Clostridiales bacterium]